MEQNTQKQMQILEKKVLEKGDKAKFSQHKIMHCAQPASRKLYLEICLHFVDSKVQQMKQWHILLQDVSTSKDGVQTFDNVARVVHLKLSEKQGFKKQGNGTCTSQ